MNYMYGDKKKKDGEHLKELQEELGDLLFTIICMANNQHLSLDEAFTQKIDKVYARDNHRFKRKNNKK